MKIIIALAVVLCLTNFCEAQPTCQLALVEWQDAVAYTRAEISNPDEMTASVLSIGCVVTGEKTLLVITSFTNGKPDIFLVIPKNWVTKITNLTKEEVGK